MDLKELDDVHLGLLNKLLLVDHAGGKGVDPLDLLLDLRLELLLGVDLGDQIPHGTLLGFGLEQVDDFLPNPLDLSGLLVGQLLDLVLLLPGETNDEEPDDVAILGLAVLEEVDKGVLLLDQGAELIPGQPHGVEVGEAGLTLDLVDLELDVLVLVLLLLLEVGHVELLDPTLQTFGLNLLTGGLGDAGPTLPLGLSGPQVLGLLDVVPDLPDEGVDLPFRLTLLGLQTLVLTIRHPRFVFLF